MTTIGGIWHAVLHRSCCGDHTEDRAECCRQAGRGAACCEEGQGKVGPQWWTRNGAPAQSSASTSHSDGALVAHNALREKPLKWDDQLAGIASRAVQEFWVAASETCDLANTAQLEKTFAINGHGMNTFALRGSCDSCGWSSVLNSWVGEQGSEACEVAHKATALSPNAKAVGCAEKKNGVCQMNICIYDHEPSKTEALSLAKASNVVCDQSACCHSIKCKNSTGCDDT